MRALSVVLDVCCPAIHPLAAVCVCLCLCVVVPGTRTVGGRDSLNCFSVCVVFATARCFVFSFGVGACDRPHAGSHKTVHA